MCFFLGGEGGRGRACKGLQYFGGIEEAKPMSRSANGSIFFLHAFGHTA